VVGELLLAGVARNQGEEVGCATVGLGAQDAAESLSLFLPRAEHPGHLNEQVRVGQVDGEVPDLGEHDAVQLPSAKAVIDLFALDLRGLSGNQGRFDLLGNGLHLSDVLSDDEHTTHCMLFKHSA